MSRNALTALSLWISLISWSIWLGGTIYQMLVVVPMWSRHLPESLVAFLRSTNFTRDVLKFFGPRWMPVRSLALLLPFLDWNLLAHRPFLIVAACSVAASLIFTIAYVYPINAVLFSDTVEGRNIHEVQTLAHHWIVADQVRLLVVSIGYLALLRAVSLPF